MATIREYDFSDVRLFNEIEGMAKPPFSFSLINYFNTQRFLNPVQNLGQSLIRDQIYPTASKNFKKTIDQSRLLESIQVLEAIGGKRLALKTEDGVSIQAITVYGYCLGSGFATELAKRHPIHLILDRPFAKIGDIIADRALMHAQIFLTSKFKLGKPLQILHSAGEKAGLSFIKSWFQKGTSYFLNQGIISYNNASKLSKVEGSLLLIQSKIDEVIPSFSRTTLKEEVQKHPRKSIYETDKIDHSDPWDMQTQGACLDHLGKFGLLRSFPETPL